MYFGIASPTEAAVGGVIGAIIISGITRTLTWENIKFACLRAVRTSSMIGMIVVGATFLGISMGYLGVPRMIAEKIAEMNLGPFQLIFVLVIFYLILGCVLEGMSAIVMTLPITLPLITAAGFDKLWFGVFLVITIEMGKFTIQVKRLTS